MIRKPSLEPLPKPPLPPSKSFPWPATYPDPPFVHYPVTEERCRTVKDPYQRQLCLEDLKYLQAVWKKDLEKCEELRDSQKKDDCINLVIKAKVIEPKNNPVEEAKNCQKIADKKLRHICIITAAVDGLDRKVCEHFFTDEPFEKKECLDKVKAFDIIRNTQNPYKDIKKCIKVKTLEYGTICFRGMLKKIKYDCNALEGKQKQMCQSLVLKRDAKTIEDCQKIPLESYRKVCIKIIKTGKSGFDLDSDNDGKSDEDATLIIDRSSYTEAMQIAEELAWRLERKPGTPEATLSMELQRSLESLAFQPVEPMLVEIGEAVTRLAKRRGLKARFEWLTASGGLDASTLEILGEILRQLVRNSLRHGIEPPEDRRLAGKNDTRTIVLHSFAHLSESKASPEFVATLLDNAQKRLEDAGQPGRIVGVFGPMHRGQVELLRPKR